MKVFELYGAAEAVATKRPRPAAAQAPMMKDCIYISFGLPPGMVNSTHAEVPYG
jgi:hypothetical protein